MLVSRLYLLAPPSGRSANTVVALDARQSLQSSYPNTPRFFLQSYAQMGLKFGIRLYISTICLPKVILDACSDLSSIL